MSIEGGEKLFRNVTLNILSPFFLHGSNLRRTVMRAGEGWFEGVREQTTLAMHSGRSKL